MAKLLIINNTKLHFEKLAHIYGVMTSIEIEKDQKGAVGTFLISIK